jgi:hypothetical protein
MTRRYPVVLLSALILGSSAPAFAQSALDRVIGRAPWNQPLTLTQLNGQNIGLLALVARVPIGIESHRLPFKAEWSIPATGRTLREVLDALMAAQPGYSWEESDGVILIRPIERASDRDMLSTRIGRFQLRDADVTDAMSALATLFGVVRTEGPGDTRRFSVDVADDSTIRDVLNAIVRAHRTMAWAFEHKDQTDLGVKIRATLWLCIGASGTSVRIPENAGIGLVPPPPVDVAAAGADSSSILERIVGPDREGRPVSISALNIIAVKALAEASRTPMGMETAGVTTGNPPMIRETMVTGMRLADALALLAAIDSRYEWREMDGVVVFRPVQAWRDALNPLFLPVPDVQLRRVTLSTVMGVIASALKGPEHASNTIVDTRRMSIDIPAGSVLDLLNAAAKSHGQLTWQFDEMSAADRRLAGGRRHLIRVWIFGGGTFGLMVP